MKGFNSLDLFFKGDILRRQADYVLSVTYSHYTVKLYSWDRFFIEQYFDLEQQLITKITIAGQSDLTKYLNDISLADLGLLNVL